MALAVGGTGVGKGMRAAVAALALVYLAAVAAAIVAALRMDDARPPLAPAPERSVLSGDMDYAMDYGPLAGSGEVVAGRVGAAYAPTGPTMRVFAMAYLDDGALWMRFSPPVVATPDGQVTISLVDNRVREARLIVERAGAVEVRDWSAFSADRRSGLSTRAPAFHFSAGELDDATLHLGYKSWSLLRTAALAESRRAWEARTEAGGAQALLYSGALGMLGLLLLAFAALLRQVDLALLGLMSLAIVSIVFGGAGFAHTILLPGSPALADIVAYVPKPLSVSLWLALLARYLGLPALAPRLHAGLLAVAVLIAFQPVLIALKIGYGWPLPFLSTTAMPFLFAFAAGVATLAWRALAGDRKAWLFALCWSPLLFGMIARSAIILAPTTGTAALLERDRLIDVAASVFLLAVALVADLQRRTATARQAAESAEQRFRVFAEVASQGFFEVDANGRVVTSAGPLAQSLALAPGEAFEAVLTRNAAPAGPGRRPVVMEAPSRDVEIEVDIGGTGRAWYAFSLAPRSGGGMVGVIADVTSRVGQRREEARMRTMVALGEMATGVAHEVNNLIHPIVNLARRLRTHHVNGEDGERLADLVIASGERAGKIVASVMANVRSAGGDAALTPLCVAVDNALDILDASIPASIVRRRMVDSTIDRPVDAGEALQVLANLAANATRAMRGAGDLAFRLEKVGEGVALAVEDDGPGIAMDEVEGDFSPLARSGDGAAGLGLSIVSQIAQKWGGRLRLSRRVGGGARAEIILRSATE